MPPTSIDLQTLILKLADAAEASVLPLYRQPITAENKACSSGFDPVTAADRAAETVIRRRIGERFPDHGIIGEEFGRERHDARFVWVIYRIDGTKAMSTS